MQINASFSLMMRNHRYMMNNRYQLDKSMQRVALGGLNPQMRTDQSLMLSGAARAKIHSLQNSEQQLQHRMSIMETADASLGYMHDVTQELHDLALRAMNETTPDEAQKTLQFEFDVALGQLVRYVSPHYLDEQYKGGVTQTVAATAKLATTYPPGTEKEDGTLLCLNAEELTKALDRLSSAIRHERSLVGATYNKFERMATQVGRDMEAVAVEESRAAGIDYLPQESIDLAKYQMLMQVGITMQNKLAEQTEQSLALLQSLPEV